MKCDLYISPFIAAVLSSFVPGLGQLAVGEEKRGFYFFCFYALLWLLLILAIAILPLLQLVLVPLPFLAYITIISLQIAILCGFQIYVIYDAYKISKKKIRSYHQGGIL